MRPDKVLTLIILPDYLRAVAAGKKWQPTIETFPESDLTPIWLG